MFAFLKKWFTPAPKSNRYLVEQGEKYRLIEVQYPDGKKVWYIEAKFRGIDLVMFAATKIAFQKDNWTFVKDTASADFGYVKRIFDHMNR